MQKQELNNQQTGETGEKQARYSGEEQAKNSGGERGDDWRSDLRVFFDEVEREDETFSDNVVKVSRFYADTARPALEDAARELKLYGRDCETGEDGGRVYIIVRAVREDEVEFQYAVVAEAKIEGITPYVHCWYEELPKDADGGGAQQNESQSKNENGGKKGEDQDDDNQDEDNQDEDNQDDDDDKSGDDKKSGEPKRTKTIEQLANWTAERGLQSITPEEIAGDFIAHYKDAVARLRAPMHERQTNNQSNEQQ